MSAFLDALYSRRFQARLNVDTTKEQLDAAEKAYFSARDYLEAVENLLRIEEGADEPSTGVGSSTAEARRPPASPDAHARVWRPCDCGCGTSISVGYFELKNRPDKKFFLNREHHHVFMRSDVGKNWTLEMREAASERQRQRWADRRLEITGTDPAPSPSGYVPVEGYIPGEVHSESGKKLILSCACPPYWYKTASRFDALVANEGHHESCPMCRPGAHFFPIPSALGDGVDVQCVWCSETKHFGPVESGWSPVSSTPTPKAIETKFSGRDAKGLKVCIDCGKPIAEKATRCRDCSHKERERIAAEMRAKREVPA